MTGCLPVTLPRWQWRTFGDDLTDLAGRLDAPDLGRGRWTDEVHLVCLRSSHHAWLQGDTLELRWRKEVGPDNVELWDPILRVSLPFDTVSVARLYAAWGLVPEQPPEDYTDTASFITAVGRAWPQVRAVRLARRRERTAVDQVACSFETVIVHPGARWQSFAVEHEDPEVIAHVRRRLGLQHRDNISFVQGLKQVLALAD